jgi:peptide/nickel transport system substrate-binding protein
VALNRAEIVSAYGGPVAALPTCQILPPGIPGYERYCPYTRAPALNGRWVSANLARGRRLVAASGTRGMKVTVWNTPGPAGSIDETKETVTALRQLGYRAALRMLPSSTYFAYTGDSRNRAQVIDGGWSADYASANDVLGKLACSYFSPANGPATTDGSELCDPSVDRQIAAAGALQAGDPAVAAARWARIDRELTDRAVFLPTVTPNEVDLVSRRAGGYKYDPVWGVLLDQLWVR